MSDQAASDAPALNSPNEDIGGPDLPGHIPNLGYMRLKWNGPQEGEKTVLITGAEPSDGAAILANAVRQLDVPVYFFPIGARFESGGGLRTFGEFRDTAQGLSARHGLWGARVPFRRGMLLSARRVVVAPHFLIAMEDPAVMAAALEGAIHSRNDGALVEAARRISTVALFAAETRVPTMIVSIQKAREFAAQHIAAISAFIGATPTREAQLAAQALIDQGARVLRSPVKGRRAVQGAIDRVQRGGQIRGWAKLPLSSERVAIRIVRDKAIMGEALANEFREDLARHQIGDGYHGFVIPLQGLSAQPIVVEVQHAADGTLIGRVEISKSGGRAID